MIPRFPFYSIKLLELIPAQTDWFMLVLTCLIFSVAAETKCLEDKLKFLRTPQESKTKASHG